MDARPDEEAPRPRRRRVRRARRAVGDEVVLSAPDGPVAVIRPDQSVEVASDAEPVVEPDPAPGEGLEPVPSFEELYDDDELAAIDAGPRTPSEPVSGISSWRRHSALGAVLTGLALGLQEIFEPERDRSSIIVEAPDDEPDDLPVRLYLDPDSPQGGFAVVAGSDPVPPGVPRGG